MILVRGPAAMLKYRWMAKTALVLLQPTQQKRLSDMSCLRDFKLEPPLSACLKLRPPISIRSPRTCLKTCQFMVVWALDGYARLDDGGRRTSCSSSPRKFGKAKPAKGAGTQRPESAAVVNSFVLSRPQVARDKRDS